MPCLGIYFDSTVIALRAPIKEVAHKSDKKDLVVNVLKNSKVHDWGGGIIMFFPDINFVKGASNA